MAKNKDFKRLVRARMAATNERYTEAHAALTASASPTTTMPADERERRGRALIAAFQEARSADPRADVVGFLDDAIGVLQPLMESDAVSPEVVRLARAIFRLQWDHGSMLRLLAHYLTLPLPLEEEFWARWEYADHLAILRRDDEAIELQLDLLRWTREHLDSSRLAEVWHDSTMARSWMAQRRGDEWYEHFWAIRAETSPTEANRAFRFEMAFTALNGLRADAPERDVLTTELRTIVDEDARWGERPWAEHRVQLATLLHALRGGDVDAMRNLAARHVDWCRSVDWLGDEAGVYCNVGYLFFLVGEDGGDQPQAHSDHLAIAADYFQRAVATGRMSGGGYIWYAATIWATSADRVRTVELLREARRRMSASECMDVFRSSPHWNEAQDDPEFIAALTG